VAMETKHISDNKVHLQSGNVPIGIWIWDYYSCLLQSTNIGFTK
jgi:hypothetical protein